MIYRDIARVLAVDGSRAVVCFDIYISISYELKAHENHQAQNDCATQDQFRILSQGKTHSNAPPVVSRILIVPERVAMCHAGTLGCTVSDACASAGAGRRTEYAGQGPFTDWFAWHTSPNPPPKIPPGRHSV